MESAEKLVQIQWSLEGAAEFVFLQMHPAMGTCSAGLAIDVKENNVTCDGLVAGKGLEWKLLASSFAIFAFRVRTSIIAPNFEEK